MPGTGCFRKFHSYYNFTARSQRGQRHEKGGVEDWWVFQAHYMVPVPIAESLEELNEENLLSFSSTASSIECREKSVDEQLRRKEPIVGTPGASVQHHRDCESKVNPYATVIQDKTLFGCHLLCGVSSNGDPRGGSGGGLPAGQKIARPERFFVNTNGSSPGPYLTCFIKPGAFDSARPIIECRKNWPDPWSEFVAVLWQVMAKPMDP